MLVVVAALVTPAITGAPIRDAAAAASEVSSPFSVGSVPPGFEVLAAGTGTDRQVWGVDEEGTEEPFTVLAPASESASRDQVRVVSVTGFRGYQGGLDQAPAGYGGGEHFTIDGREAIYAPAGEAFGRSHWADLVVRRGRDLAVRVTAPEASRRELVEVARRTRAHGRSRAPEVLDPPGGLRVIGSVDADVVVGLRSMVSEFSVVVPGMTTAHSMGWTSARASTLAVMTVPGGADALRALPAIGVLGGWRWSEIRTRKVGGRSAVAVEDTRFPVDPRSRVAYVPEPTGRRPRRRSDGSCGWNGAPVPGA